MPTDDDRRDVSRPQPSPTEVETALAAGCRFVQYEYCVSLVLFTLRRPTRLHCLRPGIAGFWPGVPASLVTLLFGWWGLPWGVVYTPLILLRNSQGGRDVTEPLRQRIARAPRLPIE